jgi:diguanylate cyclase (GGDEF)-like protein
MLVGQAAISLLIAGGSALWLSRASTPDWLFGAQTLVAIPLVANAVAMTGGADSPARFWILQTVVFTACFLRGAPRLLGWCVAIMALPLTYDPRAVPEGYLGEFLVLAPMSLAIGACVVIGKRQLLELRARAEEQADTDPLTGIGNRRRFERDVAAALASPVDPGTPGALLMIDIDHFKRVNDSFGHAAGDGTLRLVGQVLLASVRAGDRVYRLGGEEFAVLTDTVGEIGTQILAERVRGEIEAATDATPVPVTVSVGVAAAGGCDDVADWIAQADAALYAAKAQGRNRVIDGAGLPPLRVVA